MKRLIAITLIAVLGQALGQAAEPFYFHTIRKPATSAVQCVIEGEFLQASGRPTSGHERFGAGWSGDAPLWDGVVGDSTRWSFPLGNRQIRTGDAMDFGAGLRPFEVRLNGKVIESKLDCIRLTSLAKLRELGELELNAGTQRIEIKLIGPTPRRASTKTRVTCTGWIT